MPDTAQSPGSSSYGDYLETAYGGRPTTYYRQFLRTPLGAARDVLDWGCGLGGMLELVASESAARIAGLDLQEVCLDRIRSRHPDWDLRLLVLPGLVAPFESASFDRIFLLDVIEHVSEPVELLRECHRLLRPGGVLTLSTPDRLAFYKREGGIVANLRFNLRRLLGREWVDPTHVTEYTVSGLRRILSASPFGDAAFAPSPWHRTLWARPPRRHYSFVVDLVK